VLGKKVDLHREELWDRLMIFRIFRGQKFYNCLPQPFVGYSCEKIAVTLDILPLDEILMGELAHVA
jgi:hypothetical protein